MYTDEERKWLETRAWIALVFLVLVILAGGIYARHYHQPDQAIEKSSAHE